MDPQSFWHWAVLLVVLLWCCFMITEFVESSGCGHLTFGDVAVKRVTALAGFMWGEGPGGPVCMRVCVSANRSASTHTLTGW